METAARRSSRRRQRTRTPGRRPPLPDVATPDAAELEGALREGARGSSGASRLSSLATRILVRSVARVADEVLADLGAGMPPALDRTLRRAAPELVAPGSRALSIALGLAPIALGYRAHAAASRLLTPEDARAVLDALHRSNAERYTELSLRHGGAFLKVGQLLSARPDLLPTAWVDQLSRLQDRARPVDFHAIREVLEADLGAPVEAHFAELDPDPVAAASIGQVHRAVTLDGREVAVKVRRPGVERWIALDLSMMQALVASLSSMLPVGDTSRITAEVRAMVLEELDYRREAAAARHAACAVAGIAGVVVPVPIPELSGERVITTPFARGRKITVVLDELARSGEAGHAASSDLLGRLLEVYLAQVLGDGAFQADPHPGNFLVADDGTLVLLDFGCTKVMPPEVRDGFGAVLAAAMTGDSVTVASWLARLGFETASGEPDTLLLFSDLLLRQFRQALGGGRVSWPTREELLESSADLLAAMRRDPVTRIPTEFVMLGRVFGLLGGLFQHYRPDIDWAKRVLPYVFRATTPASVSAP